MGAGGNCALPGSGGGGKCEAVPRPRPTPFNLALRGHAAECLGQDCVPAPKRLSWVAGALPSCTSSLVLTPPEPRGHWAHYTPGKHIWAVRPATRASPQNARLPRLLEMCVHGRMHIEHLRLAHAGTPTHACSYISSRPTHRPWECRLVGAPSGMWPPPGPPLLTPG